MKMQADRIFLMAIIALATIGVPLNALFLQDGRHPAPLFQSPSRTVAPAERTPLPPPRPFAAGPARPAPANMEAANADSAKPSVAHPHEKTRDPIGLLLLGGAPKSDEADKTDKKALFAQRALTKLGYNVRVDGKFGGSTRQAIEKFERDSGLPVKGELTPKIMRQLSARSGVAME
jgi:hypothetical protein